MGEQVPNLVVYIYNEKFSIQKYNMAKYISAKISFLIPYYLEH